MLGCSVCTFPFSIAHNTMLTMLVCATHWLSMHLYKLAYIFIHESCLLVCHPYFNIMKLWTSDPNLHLSPRKHHLLFAFFLVCLFPCLFAFQFACLSCCLSCYACFACMLVCFILIMHCLRISFFPLLVYQVLVFGFACTHMEWGHIELGHGLPSASIKGADASMQI